MEQAQLAYTLGLALGWDVGDDTALHYQASEQESYVLDGTEAARARRLKNAPAGSSDFDGDAWRAFHSGVIAGLKELWTELAKPF